MKNLLKWPRCRKWFAIDLLLILSVLAVLRLPDAYGLKQSQLTPLPSPAVSPFDSGTNASAGNKRQIRIEWVLSPSSGQDRFSPDLIIVNQGDTVELTFLNNDTVAHNLVIGYPYNIHVNASVPGLVNDLTGQEFTSPATNNSPGVVVSGLPGSVVATYTFVAKYAGIFEFVCTYHIPVGMLGYMVVIPNSAFNIVAPNATVPQSPITTQVSIDAGSGFNVKLPGYTARDITVVIGVNNTVKWYNNDNVPHTVTAVDNSFDSGNINAGQAFVHTFTKPGKYPYICSYHPWMSGTVTVLAGAAGGQSATTTSLLPTTTTSLLSTSSSVSKSTTTSSSSSQSPEGFTITLTAFQIYRTIAVGIIILVLLMVALAMSGRKKE